jgi:hypothetical protein
MAISLSCVSCQRKIKAKDEHAGRKIKCPECGQVLTVPPAVPAAEEETTREPAPRQDTEAPEPRRRRPGGILSMDTNQLGEAFKNFDVRRFTIVGWLLFAVSVAVAALGYVLVEMNYETIMDVPKNQRMYTKWFAPYAIAVSVGGLGCFFLRLGNPLSARHPSYPSQSGHGPG